jgi:NAD(P)H-dependent flavin oxidoreductase YrpB (nitropropane dioxygenase family)
MDWQSRLGLEHRVIQAPLGGGIARAELASAVSRAGGLGTVCTVHDPADFRAEIQLCREQAMGRPFSVNLLFPSMTRQHVEVCLDERVPAVSLFFGFDARLVRRLHERGAFVLHQVGSVAQARRALRDGADALVAQGQGAGGHVLATEPMDSFVPKLIDAARGKPVFAAGGIHDRPSALRARALGAEAVWVGTRFLLTPESHAHPAYKERLLAARSTLETLLFGMGWHALHRVVPNLATERWCARDELGPKWLRAATRILEPLTRLAPPRAAEQVIALQRVDRPLFSPIPLVRGMKAGLVEVTPLYAGECVTRIRELRSAADVVRELSV